MLCTLQKSYVSSVEKLLQAGVRVNVYIWPHYGDIKHPNDYDKYVALEKRYPTLLNVANPETIDGLSAKTLWSPAKASQQY
jgi:hypothetical protein